MRKMAIIIWILSGVVWAYQFVHHLTDWPAWGLTCALLASILSLFNAKDAMARYRAMKWLG